METITSRQNPLMTHIRKLAGSAAYRRQTGQCLCDSPKLLREAAQWGAEVQTVVSVEPWPEPLPEKVRQVLVPPEVMASISPAKTPQGVLFTCRAPVLPVPETLPGRRYVVLDGVQDPGNVGTVLRTLDAFDADGLLLTGGCADPFGPKTVRASMGAVFRRPVWSVTPEELGDLLFAAVKVARFFQIDAERALDAACEKFIRRFAGVEAAAAAQGKPMSAFPVATLMAFWDQMKDRETKDTKDDKEREHEHEQE